MAARMRADWKPILDDSGLERFPREALRVSAVASNAVYRFICQDAKSQQNASFRRALTERSGNAAHSVIPAKAGIQYLPSEGCIPAYAGMTESQSFSRSTICNWPVLEDDFRGATE